MERLSTYNGKGISTKLSSISSGKKYIISTAPKPNGGWQLAVFKSFVGLSNIFKPLRVKNTSTFDEAQQEHLNTELMVTNLTQKEWQNCN